MRNYINLVETFLKEMPIQNIEARIGTFNGNGFDQKDQALISSPIMKKRYIQAFRKTPFNFEIFFDDDAALPGPNRHMNDAGHWIAKINDGKGGGVHLSYKDIKGKPGVIRVVLVGNLSDNNKLPLTPWMLAHKIGHSFEDSTFWKRPVLSNLFNKFFKLLSFDDTDNFNLFSNLVTTKYGRTGFDSVEEVPAEIIAQYLINGKVTLSTDNLMPIDNELLPENFDIDKLEVEVNSILFKIFNMLRGKVLIEL